MNLIVFSKNRAFQLDAFLNSAKINAQLNPEQITVLFKYDEEFLDSLKILKTEHNNVRFIEETNFYDQVMSLLEHSSDVVSFATDDALFTRKLEQEKIIDSLNFSDVLCYSSRLGLNLDFCYPLNSSQSLPNGQLINESFYFNWRISDKDWGYPMSVDGHFFRRNFLIDVLKGMPFKNPNTLEVCMTYAPKRFSVPDIVASGIHSHYFNVPLNVVQSDFNNRHGNLGIKELNEKYLDCQRFDVSKIYQFMNNSAHQEISISD